MLAALSRDSGISRCTDGKVPGSRTPFLVGGPRRSRQAVTPAASPPLARGGLGEAERRALGDHDVGVVEQPIHRGRGQRPRAQR